ncbi:MAG TPA: DUF6036 family nucleotidyltransferase [Candidatus Angelobacter sp.]|nr:DUF6036 family nucleotidyltransferase [Candidatus Angelobacter sp.]
MTLPDLFRRISSSLEQSQIDYMLTGSYASTLYGMGRASQDIDLVISADQEQVKRLIDRLAQNNFYAESHAALEACRRKSMFNAIDNVTLLKVDFIFRKTRNFSIEEFSRRRSALVQGVDFFVATAEDVVISKLEWAKLGESARQIEDVVGILKVRGKGLDRPNIEKWVAELGLASEWSRARQLAGLV